MNYKLVVLTGKGLYFWDTTLVWFPRLLSRGASKKLKEMEKKLVVQPCMTPEIDRSANKNI